MPPKLLDCSGMALPTLFIRGNDGELVPFSGIQETREISGKEYNDAVLSAPWPESLSATFELTQRSARIMYKQLKAAIGHEERRIRHEKRMKEKARREKIKMEAKGVYL